jgi:hypothetical protein
MRVCKIGVKNYSLGNVMKLYLYFFLFVFIFSLAGCKPKIKYSLNEMSVFILISKVEKGYEIKSNIVLYEEKKYNSKSNSSGSQKRTISVPGIVIEQNTFGEIGMIENNRQDGFTSEVLIGDEVIKTYMGSGVIFKLKVVPTNEPEIVNASGMLIVTLENSLNGFNVIPFTINCNLNIEKRIFYKSHSFDSRLYIK